MVDRVPADAKPRICNLSQWPVSVRDSDGGTKTKIKMTQSAVDTFLGETVRLAGPYITGPCVE